MSEATDRASFEGSLRLTDKQWSEIVRLRPPCVPEATARTALNRALADYRRFDPKKLKAERLELRRIVKLARELEAALRRRQALPWPEAEVIHQQVLVRARSILNRLDRYISDRARRIPLEHAILLGRLFDIWIDLFGGNPKLPVSDPPGGRKPRGLLVRFIYAVTQDIVRPPINPNTIRYVARFERVARLEHEERKRQLMAVLRAMMPVNGNLERKK